MYAPLNYEQTNIIEGRFRPSNVKVTDNVSYSFWCRSLFQRIASQFDLTVPDAWSGSVTDFLMYCLIMRGYVLVSRNEEFGFFFQPASLTGFDFYYQPVKALVANPAWTSSREFVLHEDGELLKLTPDYAGLQDIIYHYAAKLAQADAAINTNLINSKLGFIAGAKNKAAAEALKYVVDQINRGEPAVIVDKNHLMPDNPKTGQSPVLFQALQKVKENYVVDELIRDQESILRQFDIEIGIPAIPAEKKERMIADEATSRDFDSTARLLVFGRCLKESISDIKRLYPDIPLDIKLRRNVEEVDSNGKNDTDRDVKLYG